MGSRTCLVVRWTDYITQHECVDPVLVSVSLSSPPLVHLVSLAVLVNPIAPAVWLVLQGLRTHTQIVVDLARLGHNTSCDSGFTCASPAHTVCCPDEAQALGYPYRWIPHPRTAPTDMYLYAKPRWLPCWLHPSPALPAAPQLHLVCTSIKRHDRSAATRL